MKPLSGKYIKKVLTGLIISSSVLLSACSLASRSEKNRTAPIAQTVNYEYFSFYQVSRGDVYKSVKESLNYNRSGGTALRFKKNNAVISKTYFKVGDSVKKGDLILECDTGTLGTKVEKLEADVKQYESELSYYTSMCEIEEKRKMICAAYGRAFDSTKLDEYNTQLELAGKQLNIAKMQLEEAVEELEGCRIYADMDGVIAYIARTSEWKPLSNNSTAVTITDSQPYFSCSTKNIRLFEIGETYEMVYFLAPKMRMGKPVGEIEEFTAPVKCISMEPVREGSDTYEIRFIPDEKDDTDYTGDLSATITIITESAENVLYVPKTAVIQSEDDAIVYVQNDNGERTIKKVEVGVSNTDVIEIVSGLEQGETVLTNNKNGTGNNNK